MFTVNRKYFKIFSGSLAYVCENNIIIIMRINAVRGCLSKNTKNLSHEIFWTRNIRDLRKLVEHSHYRC